MTCQVNSASALTVLYLDLWDDPVLVVDERLQIVDDQFNGPIFRLTRRGRNSFLFLAPQVL